MAKKSVKLEVDCDACDNGVIENNERCPHCNGSGYVIVYVMVDEDD
jgi:DnaJ-class molecular chaperone